MTFAANSLSVTGDAPRPVMSPLRGRIDAIEGGRVYGWAWHPGAPRQRLSVRILDGDEQVAMVIADKPRIDLRRNGVGDGGHAFDIELHQPIAGTLRAVALHPDGGPDLELDVPASSASAESTIAASFGPVLDRLEAAIIAQRRIQGRQSASLAEFVTTKKAMVDRLAELEVMLVRFDGVMHGFSSRLEALAKQNVHPVKGHLLWLTAAVGLVIGVALTAAMRL
ncbi:MAG TPA: hypothetical protein VHA70_06715 [Bauldia sp.]|nr:hypothetical protein [Bauldia sp.]